MRPDVESRLRAELDRVPAPDLWHELIEREHQGPPFSSRRESRFAILILALAVAGGGIWLAVRAFTGGSNNGPSSVARVKVSGHAADAPLDCTVTLLTPTVAIGDTVRTVFAYSNTGDTAFRLPVDGGTPRLLVYNASGDLLYDTDTGPYGVAGIDAGSDLEEVVPGESLDRSSEFVALWGGDLTLKPMCGYGIPDEQRKTFVRQGVIELPPLTVHVEGLGMGFSPADALDRVLGATGGLFDKCKPRPDGHPVTGSIEAPATWQGHQLPPMPAVCAAEVRSGQGGITVDLLFASPDDLPLPQSPGEGPSRGLDLPVGVGVQMGRWTFVVTPTTVQEVTPSGAGRLVQRSIVGREPEGLGTVFRGPKECVPGGSCRTIEFDLLRGKWVERQEPLVASVPGELWPGIHFFYLGS